MTRDRKKQDIRNFLLVILGGIVGALLVVYTMVQVNPFGNQRRLSEVMLSPQTVETISNRAVHQEGKFSAHYLIEALDFSFYNPKKARWEKIEVDIGPYEAFWKIVQRDKGEETPSEAVLALFNDRHTAHLDIYIRSRQPYQSTSQTRLFQRVEFIPEKNWYRVSNHKENDPTIFYFQHPGIYEKVLSLFQSS